MPAHPNEDRRDSLSGPRAGTGCKPAGEDSSIAPVPDTMYFPPPEVVDDSFGLVLAPGYQLESVGGAAQVVPFEGEESARTPIIQDFGKYELLAEIGRGGMGVVYKARHKELGRIVALKMILSSHLASPEHVERFYAEARAVAKLDSPHIVGIHDVGQIRGQHYLEMDYVAGPSLAQIVVRGPLDPQAAARFVYPVARAVAHLHAQGIVHRDLKPSNVLVDPEGRPRVTDFGLAKVLQSDGNMTRSGAIVGTPCYMPPEQAAGKGGTVGPASDVYSLGAILFELLTGRPPYSGRNPLDVVVQVLESEPPRPRRLCADIPHPLEQICLKCMERDPADRYSSASALAEDLDHFLRGEQIEARRTDLWHHLKRWVRRQPALASRLGTMGLLGLIYQANRYLVPAQPFETYRLSLIVILCWALASILFESLLHRERLSDLTRAFWAVADVVMFTLLVHIHEGLSTSLVAGYFLLIAASGLWFREQLVWITTALAVFGYFALVIVNGINSVAPLESPYRHVVFATALAVSGLITGFQVKRVRALSQYYEHRPLP